MSLASTMTFTTLRGGEEIRRVMASGKRVAAGRVVLYVLPSGGPPRAAFVCTRSVGGAVLRNRARRLLREAWRAVVPRVLEGWDVVIMARAGIGSATTAEVVNDVAGALAASGVVER